MTSARSRDSARFRRWKRFSPRHHVLTLTVNAYPLRQQHADINALVPQPASNDLNQKGVTVGLTDRYQFGSGAIFSTDCAVHAI